MPDYTYRCDKCDLTFSIHRSIREYHSIQICPTCGSSSQVYRDFESDGIYVQNKLSLDQIKTLGHYAERQTQLKGKLEVEDMRKKFKTKKQERPLPPGFSKLTKEDYVRMPSHKRKKGKII